MIKKIIACLTICFIITGILSPVFSDASALPQPNWSDPGISEIINISDLTGWMLNGGTFDVSQYTDAESFMNDYFNARTKTRLISPGESAEDYYEVLPGFGINNQLVAGESFARPLDTNRVISSSFRDHTGYGRRLSNQVNNALLSTGSLYDTKIPLLNEVEFANFVGYNHDALRLYNEFFTSQDNNPTYPDDYGYLIELINGESNGYGFFWGNYEQGHIYNGINWYSKYYPFTSISYFKRNYSYEFLTFSSTPYQQTDLLCSDSVLTLNINSIDDNNYQGIINNINMVNPSSSASSDFSWGNGSRLNFLPNGDWYGNNGDFRTATSCTFNGTSILEVLSYFAQRFRNINIYVDNEPWSIVSPISSPTITPEFPDAVGGEDLSVTTWPISRPRAPYYTNVPGVLQAIEDAIADDGKLDIDDLKPYLTDENGDPVPDPIFDPEPIPIPVPDPVNPDVVPGLPVLPAIPPEMPGFNGVSVLAEIINFTNQSLPTALIITFWGIVFGIVILGLIKILHK